MAKVHKKQIRIDGGAIVVETVCTPSLQAENALLNILEICVSLQISENSDIRYARI